MRLFQKTPAGIETLFHCISRDAFYHRGAIGRDDLMACRGR